MIQPTSKMARLCNRPEVVICVRCAYSVKNWAWEIEDQSRTGLLVRQRDRLRHTRKHAMRQGLAPAPHPRSAREVAWSANAMNRPPTLEALISCPRCGTRAVETMPEDACQHFYRCTGCGETLRPLDDDCCVFCSYSDHQCPPKRAEQTCDRSTRYGLDSLRHETWHLKHCRVGL